MYWHTTSRLRGPFSRDRACWKIPVADSLSVRTGRLGVASIRTDLISRVRREIAEGCYDTPDKWEAAVGRLLMSLE
jgi:hypothetical protein